MNVGPALSTSTRHQRHHKSSIRRIPSSWETSAVILPINKGPARNERPAALLNKRQRLGTRRARLAVSAAAIKRSARSRACAAAASCEASARARVVAANVSESGAAAASAERGTMLAARRAVRMELRARAGSRRRSKVARRMAATRSIGLGALFRLFTSTSNAVHF